MKKAKKLLRAYRMDADVVELIERSSLSTGLSMTEIVENCVRRYHCDVIDAVDIARQAIRKSLSKHNRSDDGGKK